MAIGTQAASIGGVLKNLIVAQDGAGDIAAAHMPVDVTGAPLGTTTNPLYVGGTFYPTVQPVSLTALPALAAGTAAIGAVSQSGAWSVAQSGAWTVSLPLGTMVAASQSGAWSVSLANGTAVSINGPLPLPVNAATATLQPALNTDGGALAHITNFPTTQAVSIAAPVAVTQSGTWTLSAATSGTYNSTPPTLTSGQSGPLQTDANGRLLATVGGSLSVSNLPATQAISATALPLPAGAATAAAQASALTQVTATATALGAPADAAWSGTGSGGVVALLKAVYAYLGGKLDTLNTSIQAGVSAPLPSGTNTIGAVTAAGTFTVAGATSVGAPPTTPPLSVAGLDSNGNKQHLLTDTTGRLQLYQGLGIATGQVSVTTTAVVIVPARTGRKSVIVKLVGAGPSTVFIGAAGVTASNGFDIPAIANAAYTGDGGAAIYGVVSSGMQNVSYVEHF